MWKQYTITLLTLALVVPVAAHAETATWKELTSNSIGTTKLNLRYANLHPARGFDFQLWSRREGSSVYTKSNTWHKRRTNKTSNWLRLKVGQLKSDHDYRIRYRGTYAKNHVGSWSTFLEFHTLAQAITINLTTTVGASDTPYVVIDDASITQAEIGGFAMTATDETRTTWTYTLPNVAKDDTIKFVFSRNNQGSNSYEQFTPDDITKLRSVYVTDLPLSKDYTVTQWRWFDPTITTGNVSTDDWTVAERDRFIMAARLESIYTGPSVDTINETFTQMVSDGFTHVIIPYAPRYITSINPIEVSYQPDGDRPSEIEMATLLSAANTAGIFPIILLEMPAYPAKSDEVAADLSGTHSNSYLATYLTRWRQTMVDGVEFAQANDIGIVLLDTPFDDLEYQSDDQQWYISYILEHDVVPLVTAGFDGIIAPARWNSDSDFTWYGATGLDWLGVEWTPDMTDSSTPVIADMYNSATSDFTTNWSTLAAIYYKPLFFTALNVYGWDGAAGALPLATIGIENVSPDYSDNPTYTRDYQEQADGYEATWRVLGDQASVIGAVSPEFLWNVQQDKWVGVRGKTAELVWARWAEKMNL